MMRARAVRLAVLAAWLASAGCMTLREIPRSDYAARTGRKSVRVETIDGLVYEFDWAEVDGDSLVGYRSRPDVEGPVDQVAVVRVSLGDVNRLTSRELDWRRTGLIGGGIVAGALALGLRSVLRHDNSDGTSSGGTKPFNP
jgi:hypothetical protein